MEWTLFPDLDRVEALSGLFSLIMNPDPLVHERLPAPNQAMLGYLCHPP